MQKLLIFTLFLLPIFLFSQRIKKEQVPAPVQKAFLSKFPNSLMVRWTKAEKNYEVDFQRNEENISAIFDEKGDWVSTQAEIDISKVPDAVKRSYSAIYKVKPEDAEKLEKAEGEAEYVLDSPDNTTTLFFSEKGIILHKETEE